MAKYVLTYHGGSAPKTPAEGDQVMAAWMAWMKDLGPALTDMGNPTGAARTVAANGTVSEGGGTNPITGYSLIEAANLDAAVKLIKGCPVLAAGGSVQVAEAIAM